MDEKSRESATNRLLEVIRSGSKGKTEKDSAETGPQAEAGQSATVRSPAADADLEKRTAGQSGDTGGSSLLGRIMPSYVETKPKPASKDSLDDVLKRSVVAEKPVETKPPPTKIPIEHKPIPKPAVEGLPPRGGMEQLLSGLKQRISRITDRAGKPAKIVGKHVFSLDIGLSSLKLVEIAKYRHTTSLISAQIRRIPPAMRKNEASLKILLTKVISELLPKEKVADAKLHLVLPDKAVHMRKLNLPSIDPKERVNAIKFQIKKELPFPIEKCEVSYRGWDSKSKGQQEIEALAIDSRVLDNYIEILDNCGIYPDHVTAAPSSLRFLAKDYRGIDPAQGAIAIADIGAGSTTISIFEYDHLVLCRTISTGGDEFTSVLEDLEVAPSGEDLTGGKAEKFKFEHGLPSESDQSMIRLGIIMRPVTEKITAEINRSLDFYRREKPDSDVQKLVLIGGGAQMKRLPEFLSRNIGIDVEVGDPAGMIAIADQVLEDTTGPSLKEGPTLLPAISAALDDGVELNMLPEKLKSALKWVQLHRYIPTLAIGMVVVLTAFYFMALSNLKATEMTYNSVKNQLVDLKKNRSVFATNKATFDNLMSEMQGREADFRQIMLGNSEIPLFLKALSHVVPDNVYLERIETNYIEQIVVPEPEEEKKPEKSNKKNKWLTGEIEQTTIDVNKVISGIISPQDTAKGEEAVPRIKRLIFGHVLELSGNVYPQGSLTDVQFVDFVFGLENSGWFREVAVDSVKTLPDKKIWFKIICGI